MLDVISKSGERGKGDNEKKNYKTKHGAQIVDIFFHHFVGFV